MKVKVGSVLVAELSTAAGGIALGGSAGTITLTMSATQTAALEPANARYDLLLTSGGGQVTALLAGLIPIRAGVS